MHRLAVLLLFALVAVAAVVGALAPFSRPGRPVPKAVDLADLLALPQEDYRVDPYLRVAESLQAMGRGRAVGLLLELAQKDQWPSTRTIVLCRMLFQARPNSAFRRARMGQPIVVGSSAPEAWASEPIDISEGVPFLITTDYNLFGHPERPAKYVRYCEQGCDWNTQRFRPRSMKEKRQALKKLVSSPMLKGKLGAGDYTFLQDQIQ
jgi:hypothetical protein